MRQFLLAFGNNWIITMSGVLSLSCWVASAVLAYFNISVATHIALIVAGATGMLLASYAVWRKEYEQRLRLEEKLRPKLSIEGAIAPQGGLAYHKIRVRNLASRSIAFRASLKEISPGIVLLPPFPLPINGQLEGVIEADGVQHVDVLLDRGAPGPLELQVAASGAGSVAIPRNQRWELLVSVSPVSPNEGQGVKRRFFIIPQADGSILFIAD